MSNVTETMDGGGQRHASRPHPPPSEARWHLVLLIGAAVASAALTFAVTVWAVDSPEVAEERVPEAAGVGQLEVLVQVPAAIARPATLLQERPASALAAAAVAAAVEATTPVDASDARDVVARLGQTWQALRAQEGSALDPILLTVFRADSDYLTEWTLNVDLEYLALRTDESPEPASRSLVASYFHILAQSEAFFAEATVSEENRELLVRTRISNSFALAIAIQFLLR